MVIIIDKNYYLKCMEEHLCHEEKGEDCEHCDAEDGSGWEETVTVLAPDGVEEEQDKLLDEKGDADTVHCASVDVLVDLRSLVGKVNVVPSKKGFRIDIFTENLNHLSTPCLMMK